MNTDLLNQLLHGLVDRLALPTSDEREQLHDDVDQAVPLALVEPPAAVDPAPADLTKAPTE